MKQSEADAMAELAAASPLRRPDGPAGWSREDEDALLAHVLAHGDDTADGDASARGVRTRGRACCVDAGARRCSPSSPLRRVRWPSDSS